METNYQVSLAKPETTQDAVEQVDSLVEREEIGEGQIISEVDNAVPGNEAILIPIIPSTPVVYKLPEQFLFITFDGLRANVISENHLMENLEALAMNGAYDWNAQTIEPSATLPGHASLLSGLGVNTHGINIDVYADLPTNTFESTSIFQLLKKFDEESINIMVVGKKKMRFFRQPGAINQFRELKNSDQVINTSVNIVRNNEFDLMFVHFPDIDQVGHDAEQTGFFNSPEYLGAADQADQLIRRLFDAMKQAEIFDSTLIIVTADHGGEGGGHSDATPLDKTIPWIIHGPCVKPGFDISTTGRVVDIFDTAPTILWALGIPFEPEIFDGTPVMEAFKGLPKR